MELFGHILLWIVLLPVHVGVIVTKYPLAPIAVEFFSSDDGKYLEFPFEWLQTKDNSLCGDSGWVSEHIEPGSDPCSDWNRIGWIWRNGGNTFNYDVIGAPYDSSVGDFKYGFTDREDGYWLYRELFNIPGTDKHLELFYGWNIFGNVNGEVKYTFTTRIQTNKD